MSIDGKCFEEDADWPRRPPWDWGEDHDGDHYHGHDGDCNHGHDRVDNHDGNEDGHSKHDNGDKIIMRQAEDGMTTTLLHPHQTSSIALKIQQVFLDA